MELINNVVSVSLATTIFDNGPVAGLIGMVLLAAPLRGQRIRRRLEQQGAPRKRTLVGGLVHLVIWSVRW